LKRNNTTTTKKQTLLRSSSFAAKSTFYSNQNLIIIFIFIVRGHRFELLNACILRNGVWRCFFFYFITKSNRKNILVNKRIDYMSEESISLIGFALIQRKTHTHT
jgi:hypothetical protein